MSTASPRPRPRLSLDELQHLRWLLGGTLALAAVASVFYLDIDSGATAAVAAAAAAGILAALAFPALPARLPAWAHRLAFPAIVVAFATDLWLTAQVLPAMVRLDLLLLLYRGIIYRQRRDDLQIVVLGLFLIIVAGVLTVSIAFAVQILGFVFCALAFLMVVTLIAAEGGEAAGGSPPHWAVQADAGRLFRRLRAVADWRLLALGAALFVGVVAVSGLLFLAIPRFQLENSLFLERFILRKAKSGFNDSIKFGDVTEIQQDDGIALNVDLSDPAQAPALPYWRMLVLDEYSGGGFKLSATLRRSALGRERTDSLVRGVGRARPGAPVWTFYLEPGVSRYLPLLGRFETLRFREAENYQASTELGVIALRGEPASMMAYRVEGMPGGASELPDPAFANRWRRRRALGGWPLEMHLSLSPADRAAMARLVAALEGGRDPGDARTLAARAVAWLRRRHAYSLSPRIPGGPGDPLVRWLDSGAPGHCELFAGGFVLLARAAGFPARVIIGFKGGSWNGYSNNFTVRNSDAHAWTEIWDAEQGAWLRVDPLEAQDDAADAAVTGAAALAPRMDRSWAARFESLRVFWYRRIVNFDQRAQIDTFNAVKAATTQSGAYLRAALERAASGIRGWLAGPWNFRRIGGALGGAAAIGSLLWAWRQRRHRWRREPPRGGRVDPVRREAGRWLARLRARGGAATPDLVAELQRLRFGARPTWPDPAPVFRRARLAVRKEMARPG